MEFSDTDLKQNILNIGRRRERITYYRPDGTPTLPLPADAYSRMYYLAKGFTTTLPKVCKEGSIKCPMCDFETEKPLGLRSHLRKHINKLEKEV